jgi:hypothetical protein
LLRFQPGHPVILKVMRKLGKPITNVAHNNITDLFSSSSQTRASTPRAGPRTVLASSRRPSGCSAICRETPTSRPNLRVRICFPDSNNNLGNERVASTRWRQSLASVPLTHWVARSSLIGTRNIGLQ